MIRTMHTPHTEAIWTDELHAPGYVWLSVAVYALPDNTRGQTGYHCVYRPLALHPDGRPVYTGNAEITDAMRADIRAYYVQHTQEQRGHTPRGMRTTGDVRHALPGRTSPCPRCQTFCDGDCQAG
jgi:hypothetical protein